MSLLIHYELARSADATRIAMMSRDFVERGLGWSWIPSRVLKRIRDRDNVVLIARNGRIVAGFAIMSFGDDTSHLDLLAVRPGYRRRGIGCKLVEWLEKSARVAGIGEVRLELREGNRGARAFYANLGYRERDTILRYYRGKESAIAMTHDLRVLPAADETPREHP